MVWARCLVRRAEGRLLSGFCTGGSVGVDDLEGKHNTVVRGWVRHAKDIDLGFVVFVDAQNSAGGLRGRRSIHTLYTPCVVRWHDMSFTTG